MELFNPCHGKVWSNISLDIITIHVTQKVPEKENMAVIGIHSANWVYRPSMGGGGGLLGWVLASKH